MGMNLKRVMELHDIIGDRLPSTYPQTTLAFFEDEKSLSKNMRVDVEKNENLYATADVETNTIMMPMSMTFIYGPKNIKTIPLNKMDKAEIADTLLHEIAHLFFYKKYGESKQYRDENACNIFARRWVKILKKEKLLQ